MAQFVPNFLWLIPLSIKLNPECMWWFQLALKPLQRVIVDDEETLSGTVQQLMIPTSGVNDPIFL